MAYTADDRLLYPNADNEAAFEILPAVAGWYNVKVVTESIVGVSKPFDEHPEFSIYVTGDLTVPAAPDYFLSTFDGLMLTLHWASGDPAVKEYELTIPATGVTVTRTPALGTLFIPTQQGAVTYRVYTYSQNNIRSTTYKELTWAYPVNLAWQDIVGGDINSDGAFYKVATDSWTNCHATSNYESHTGPMAVEYTVDSTAGFKLFGLSYSPEPSTQNNVEYAIYMSNGSLELRENATPYTSLPVVSYDAGDKLEIRISASGVVTYYHTVAGSLTSTLLRTTGAVATKHPMFLAAVIFTQGVLFNTSMTFSGVMVPRVGSRPTWWNNVRVNVDLGNSNLLGNGTLVWGECGISSQNRLSAGQDGAVEFQFGETNKFKAIGFSSSDINQQLTTIGLGLYAQADGNVYSQVGAVTGSSLGSFLTTDVFRIAREGSLMVIRKNGFSIFTSAVIAGVLYVDTAFYSAGSTINNVRLFLGHLTADTTTQDFQKHALVEGLPSDILAGRGVGSVDQFLEARGDDNGLPMIQAVLDARVYYAMANPFDTLDSVEVQLYVNLPTDTYTNFQTIRRIRVRVLNQFGEQVSGSILPIDLVFSLSKGGGLLPKFNHPRTYCDPWGQAIYALSFENYAGWSQEIFVSGELGVVNPPVFYSRRVTPLGLCATEGNVGTIELGWQTPLESDGGIWVQARQLSSELGWSAVAGDGTAGLNEFTLDGTMLLILPGRWYEIRIVNGGTFGGVGGVPSNIVAIRMRDVPVEEPQGAPATDVRAIIIDDDTVRVKWTLPPMGDVSLTIVSVRVYRNGAEIASLGPTEIEYDMTGHTPGTLYEYQVAIEYTT